jgi:hypothetical protein
VISSGVMEGLAVLWWMRVFARSCRGKRLLLEGDNSATMQAIRKGYSPSPSLMATVHRVCQSEARHRIVLRARAILGMCTHALMHLRATHWGVAVANCNSERRGACVGRVSAHAHTSHALHIPLLTLLLCAQVFTCCNCFQPHYRRSLPRGDRAGQMPRPKRVRRTIFPIVVASHRLTHADPILANMLGVSVTDHVVVNVRST